MKKLALKIKEFFCQKKEFCLNLIRGARKKRKNIFLFIIFLVIISFYVGFLVGKNELDKKITREIELRTKSQLEEIQNIKKERNISPPSEEEVIQQLRELEYLRNKNR